MNKKYILSCGYIESNISSKSFVLGLLLSSLMVFSFSNHSMIGKSLSPLQMPSKEHGDEALHIVDIIWNFEKG